MWTRARKTSLGGRSVAQQSWASLRPSAAETRTHGTNGDATGLATEPPLSCQQEKSHPAVGSSPGASGVAVMCTRLARRLAQVEGTTLPNAHEHCAGSSLHGAV